MNRTILLTIVLPLLHNCYIPLVLDKQGFIVKDEDMDSMKTYNIICSKCKGERQIQLHSTAMGKRIDWLEETTKADTPIVSGRERLDGAMGFQCICGNNDLLTEQEKRIFSNPASPKPQEINDIVKNLKVDQPKFEMVSI